MPEVLCEEEGDKAWGQHKKRQDRSQMTDLAEGAKQEHLYFREGSLSSVRAAVKQTRANSQSDCRRERRPSDIKSVEPLSKTSCFSRGSVVLLPQSGIQTVSQVNKEKTQEDLIVKGPAAQRSTCKFTGRKPQKPPRTSLPKSQERKPSSERHVKAGTKSSAFTVTETQSDFKSDTKRLDKAVSSQTCSRSVTVHWNIPRSHRSVTVVHPDITSSNSENSERPIPRPRTKLHKFAVAEEVQTLVKFSENLDYREVSTNNYLEELPEAESRDFEESAYSVGRSDKKSQEEDADGEMNTNHGQQNFRARIQAFEGQAGAEEEDVFQSTQPSLPPRRASFKPPVAAKPSAAFRRQSLNDINQNTSTAQNSQNPFAVPRPQPPTKPARQSIRDKLEVLHSKGNAPHTFRPSVLTGPDATEGEEASQFPSIPLVKPLREPLKPNLNINNHNSASVFTDENHDSLFNNIPVKPQFKTDGNGSIINRPSIGKRPTTIKVPSKSGSKMDFSSVLDNFQDSPPPLPVQKPIGSLNSSGSYKQIIKPSLPLQNPFSVGPEPPLPPRKPNMKKSLPPRPPQAKSSPARPPPPNFQAAGPSQSASHQSSPKYVAQMPPKKGLILPPRPNPGHRLYNKYTLELPHAIGSMDYDGSDSGELSFQKNEVLVLLGELNHDEYECQVGEDTGRVHRSRMKIITPLEADFSPPQDASGGDGYGLKVEAMFDFIPAGPGELSLMAGDVVTEVEQVDSQWYRGTCNEVTGFFPINYVKVLSNSPKLLPQRKTKPKSTVSGPRCVARFDFDGEHSDELSFSEGDVIQLMEYVGEDWARGQVGISVGIFPLNFVDVIEDLPLPPSQQKSSRVPLPGMAAPPSMQPEAAPPVQAPKSSVQWATALYDYAAKSRDELSFQQGDCILITKHIDEDWSCGRLNGREGMFPRAFVEPNTGQQMTNNQENGAAGGGGRARAMYSFSSDCDEELSVQAGDIITNLESIDDEWFLGDLRGKRALVPKNYVQVLK